MKESKYIFCELTMAEAIEKGDFTCFFETKEAMAESISIEGSICCNQPEKFGKYYKGCKGLHCEHCPFHGNNLTLRKKLFTENLLNLRQS